MTASARLSDHAANVYSQNGEDGMIAEILRRLAVTTGTCVEFGAHDGVTFSNTARLWRDGGWRAALIESDAGRRRLLADRARDHDCVAVHCTVTATGKTGSTACSAASASRSRSTSSRSTSTAMTSLSCATSVTCRPVL